MWALQNRILPETTGVASLRETLLQSRCSRVRDELSVAFIPVTLELHPKQLTQHEQFASDARLAHRALFSRGGRQRGSAGSAQRGTEELLYVQLADNSELRAIKPGQILACAL